MVISTQWDTVYRNFIEREKTIKAIDDTKWYQFIKRAILTEQLHEMDREGMLDGIAEAMEDLEKAGIVKRVTKEENQKNRAQRRNNK